MYNPIALRKAKIVYNFGLFECKRVKPVTFIIQTLDQVFFFLSFVIPTGPCTHGNFIRNFIGNDHE